MSRPVRALPSAAPVPKAALQRRRQQIVVRAPTAAEQAPPPPSRPCGRTLPGLGFRAEADTLPAIRPRAFELDDTPPVSGIRARDAGGWPPLSLTDLTPRARPVMLIDGVHDGLSRDYLAEAKRLLESGIFGEGTSD